ncbi:MAG: barstar family protein [Azonexus sp.]
MSEKFIRKADRAGVYYLPASRRAAAEAAAEKAHLRSTLVKISRGMHSGALLKQLGEALSFPDWYGANFDALHDCLTDSDFVPGKGLVLFLTGTAILHKGDPDGFATLIEVFQAVAGELGQSGIPFWVLLDSPATGISVLPEA